MPRKRNQRPGLRVVTRPGTRALYLRGTVRGRRVYESAGTDDPALAEEARAAREVELFRGAVLGTRPCIAFAAAALSYLEAEPRSAAVRLAVGKIVRALGPKALCTEVDQARLDRLARIICRPDAKPATRLRQVVTPTRAILLHAARRGWCAAPVFERTRASAARTDWITPGEAERLIASANRRIRPLFVFLLCTGARLGEALALEWCRVDLPHGRALFRQTKSGRDRIVELPPRAVAALANLVHRDGRVFRHRAGRAYRVQSSGASLPFGGQVRFAWRTACQAAGIKAGITPHHARHTWATWHYCVHRDPLRLREDGGWKSASQVERYAKLAPAALAPEVEQFWGGGTGIVQRAASMHLKLQRNQ